MRALAGLAVLLVVPIAGADEPSKPSPSPAGATKPGDRAGRAEPSLAERFAQIRAEYDAQRDAYAQALQKAGSQREMTEIHRKLAPDEVAYSRRMVDLAESSPADPAARDALIWVIGKGFMLDTGAYGDEFAHAGALLVRHHGDDPEAVRIGLGLSNVLTHRRDALLLGFYASAKGREAKGLARLALAQYLERKAQFATAARKGQGRQKVRHQETDDHGKLVTKETDQSDEQYAYVLHLRLCDPDRIRAEAERLYEEVVTEYGDVPFITRRQRDLEALLKEPEPRWNGRPLSDEDRRRVEQVLARKRTLGETAEARLDDMHNLAVGKPAPEIEGVDLEGRPLKLSDYRGKVVVLVFWGSWCGPCMAQVPHERELVARLKGKPFALLGVDCDEDKAAARRAVEREQMTWPSWYDGAPGDGPIVKHYHIRRYPTLFVLDTKGVIRARDARGEGLDQAVDKLLNEMEPTKPSTTDAP
jgi:thiol-disulfide isomerase/thioredoxin